MGVQFLATMGLSSMGTITMIVTPTFDLNEIIPKPEEWVYKNTSLLRRFLGLTISQNGTERNGKPHYFTEWN